MGRCQASAIELNPNYGHQKHDDHVEFEGHLSIGMASQLTTPSVKQSIIPSISKFPNVNKSTVSKWS